MKIQTNFRFLYLFLAIASGALFLFLDFIFPAGFFLPYLERLVFILLVITSFLFFKEEIQFVSNINGFLEILWKGFITCVVFFGMVFVIRTVEVWNAGSEYEGKDMVSYLIYHSIGISIVIFQGSTYYVFKKLTFYPKVKSIVSYWAWFEWLLLAMLLSGSLTTAIHPYVLFACIGLVAVFAIFLTIKLRWVVYLDFRQKLQALFLVVSIFLMGVYFLQLFIGKDFKGLIPDSISSNLFIYCQFTFFGVYALFSILILLFNLPTSGVFEKKFEEIVRFQHLSATLQQGKDQEHVMELLLESCRAISLADMAWLRYHDSKESTPVLARINITDQVIGKLTDYLVQLDSDVDTQEIMVKDLSTLPVKIKAIGNQGSLLSIPIRTASFNIGYLVLLKLVKDGFERDIVNVLRMYTHQASISLENMILLSEAIEKERYLEEIKISKRVQISLLPKENLNGKSLEIAHFSKSTGTVGGDFFDYYTSNEQTYWLAIGDVAGKGTAAAFLMAQLKGIFRSLVQVCSGPKNLVVRANHALAYTTEKNAFITFSVFLVDIEKRSFKHVRAGHCQALFYSGKDDTIHTLEPKGMGLGILKDDTFKDYIEEDIQAYQPGDLLVLYTDGVTEARNHKGEMFCINTLISFLRAHKHLQVDELVAAFTKSFYNFCNPEGEEDDVTFMVVRLL